MTAHQRPMLYNYPEKLVRNFEHRVSPRQFGILILAAAGKSYPQIAADLNCPLGTVKSRLSRARDTLQALMDGDKHPNGTPMWSPDGTLLDEAGNRSIFDDVDE